MSTKTGLSAAAHDVGRVVLRHENKSVYGLHRHRRQRRGERRLQSGPAPRAFTADGLSPLTAATERNLIESSKICDFQPTPACLDGSEPSGEAGLLDIACRIVSGNHSAFFPSRKTLRSTSHTDHGQEFAVGYRGVRGFSGASQSLNLSGGNNIADAADLVCAVFRQKVSATKKPIAAVVAKKSKYPMAE